MLTVLYNYNVFYCLYIEYEINLSYLSIQYTIHYEGKSFSCPRTQKGFTSHYMHFSSFKICSHKIFSVSHFTPRFFAKTLLHKSYFKISTFQAIFLCSSSFN